MKNDITNKKPPKSNQKTKIYQNFPVEKLGQQTKNYKNYQPESHLIIKLTKFILSPYNSVCIRYKLIYSPKNSKTTGYTKQNSFIKWHNWPKTKCNLIVTISYPWSKQKMARKIWSSHRRGWKSYWNINQTRKNWPINNNKMRLMKQIWMVKWVFIKFNPKCTVSKICI